MRKSIYRSASGRAVVQRWCIAELDRWDVPMRRSTLVVDDVDTHVLQTGSGPETVVFLPGTNFPAAICRPLLQTLAGRSSVIAPDVPGQPGLSDEHRPPARGRLDWYGRWLSGLWRRRRVAR